MHVNKIGLFSAPAINNSSLPNNQQRNYMSVFNRINVADSLAFTGSSARLFPEDVMNLASRVVKRRGEIGISLDYKKPLEVPTEIFGVKQNCKVSIGQYCGGHELCMDIGEGKNARRYRIELSIDYSKNSLPNFDVRHRAKLKIQKQGKLTQSAQTETFCDFVSLQDKKTYATAVSVVRTILETLSKVNQSAI